MPSIVKTLLLIVCLIAPGSALRLFGPPRTRARAREYAIHAVANSKLVLKADEHAAPPSLLGSVARVLPLKVMDAPVANRKKTAQKISDDLEKLK